MLMGSICHNVFLFAYFVTYSQSAKKQACNKNQIFLLECACVCACVCGREREWKKEREQESVCVLSNLSRAKIGY